MSKNKYWSTATDDVRNAFMFMRKDKNAASKAFYIWLAEVKAQAWQEGALTVYQDNSLVGGVVSANPYRKENK